MRPLPGEAHVMRTPVRVAAFLPERIKGREAPGLGVVVAPSEAPAQSAVLGRGFVC